MKIKTRIQLFSSLFMFFLILLVNASIYFLFYHQSLKAEWERLDTKLTATMEALAEVGDMSKMNTLLRAYVPSDGLIRIINKDGKILQSVMKETDYNKLPKRFTKEEKQELPELEIMDEKYKFAVISIPIIWENGEVVTLQIAENLHVLKNTMSILSLVLFIASLFILIPTILAGRMLSNFLLQPIQIFIHTMKKNEVQGNWEMIDIEDRSHDELYQMGDTFNRMIHKLKESFEKQKRFVSDASHELKTPISIIKSYNELLARRGKEQPEVFDESVQAISSEADRMQQLVEQMLTLAKDETTEKLHMTSFDIHALCKEASQTFQGAYQRKVHLVTELDQREIYADKEKVKQTIYILMDNALKYSDKDVSIILGEQSDTISVAIQDKGEGIEQAMLDKIFGRFYRVDKARSRETGGTGLGLSIANTIIRAHDGSIHVDSTLGEGSTFTILLPKKHQEK